MILKAISAGDAEAAREAMRAHSSAAWNRYRKQMISRQSDYLAKKRRQAKIPNK
jgi:DNA-binding GntR family transcriptional regulator